VACAQFNYGQCLFDGLGAKQDKGIECITKAATNEDESALLFLGKRYIEGKDVQKNVKKGFEMLTKAAEKGNIVAMDAVGSCYATGNGVDRNFNKGSKGQRRGDISPRSST
jgi:TPR repeat protein